MKTRHLLNILLLALYTSSCNKEDTPLIKTETVKIFLLSETNRIQNEDIENHEYILAKEENQVTQYLDDIKLVGEVLDSDPQIVQFFNHVLIENDKKIQLLDQSFKGNVDQYVLNFLKLLVQSRRIRYIDDIVKSYINLSNQYLGIEEGVIYTPYELTDQQIQDIEKAISQKENKKVTLKVSIDPSLLGGIKVQIANRIYDGTIKNKVEMLKKELLRK